MLELKLDWILVFGPVMMIIIIMPFLLLPVSRYVEVVSLPWLLFVTF